MTWCLREKRDLYLASQMGPSSLLSDNHPHQMACTVGPQFTFTSAPELPWPYNHSLNISHTSWTSVDISSIWNDLLRFFILGLFCASFRCFLFWEIFLSISKGIKVLSFMHLFFGLYINYGFITISWLVFSFCVPVSKRLQSS